MDEFFIKLGKRVALKRKRKKMSQEALAELAGLHRTYIGSIERGEYNISLKNVRKIANALNCPIDNLLKDLE